MICHFFPAITRWLLPMIEVKVVSIFSMNSNTKLRINHPNYYVSESGGFTASFTDSLQMKQIFISTKGIEIDNICSFIKLCG